MTTRPDEAQEWLAKIRQMNPHFDGKEYGLHLQSWLEEQDSDETGCPLIDQPFVIGFVDNDSL